MLLKDNILLLTLLALLVSLAISISVNNDGAQTVFLTPTCAFSLQIFVQSNFTGYKPFVDLYFLSALTFQSVSSAVGCMCLFTFVLFYDCNRFHPHRRSNQFYNNSGYCE
jgi:hypothetical protein